MAKPSPSHSKDPVLVALGVKIRELRTSLGVSQEQLANEAGIDRSYMGGIERGEHNLTIINLVKISNCLQVKLSQLFGIASL